MNAQTRWFEPDSPGVISSPVELTWEITNRSPFCPMFSRSQHSDGTTHEVPYSKAIDIIQQAAAAGVMLALFDGGEPFARSDFIDILKTATPLFCCYVLTSGYGIDDRVAAELRAVNIGNVFVYLNSADEAIHNRTMGGREAHALATAAISHLVAARVPVVIATRLTRWAAEGYREIIALAKSMNVAQVSFMNAFPSGAVTQLDDDWSPSHDEIALVSELASQETGIRVTQPHYPDIHNCCRIFFTILADGQVTPCTYIRNHWRFGNAYSDRLLDVWRRSDFEGFRNASVSGACRSCYRFSDCGGGCRAMAFRGTGRWDTGDPSCAYLQGITQ